MKKIVQKIKRIIFRKKYNRRRAYIIFGSIISVIILIFIITIINDNPWIQTGNVISNGKESYNIGDYYEYDETRKGKYNLEDVKWKVYGVDENNNLLIVSSRSVETLSLGSSNNLEQSKLDYIEGSNKINEIVKKYSKGKKAIAARSINTNDVIKSLNVNPEYIEKEIEYTYYWNVNEEPNYITINNGKGTLSLPHKNNFLWFEQTQNQWKNSKKSNGNIAVIKNNLIEFQNKIYDEYNKIIFDIKENNDVYSMLFLKDNGATDSYWLDTKYSNATSEKVSYGYNAIKDNSLSSSHIIHSTEETQEHKYGIKIIITIKK